MQSIIDSTPSSNIIAYESEHIILSFCTLCTLLRGKKLSLQNVFILILQDSTLREILKEQLGCDSNYDVVKLFLTYDPNITKSKYITKYTSNMIEYMSI